jgi:hypothetical protein
MSGNISLLQEHVDSKPLMTDHIISEVLSNVGLNRDFTNSGRFGIRE